MCQKPQIVQYPENYCGCFLLVFICIYLCIYKASKLATDSMETGRVPLSPGTHNG